MSAPPVWLRLVRVGSDGVRLGEARVDATAAIHGIRLWTRNRRHYPIKDVQFFSPAG